MNAKTSHSLVKSIVTITPKPKPSSGVGLFQFNGIGFLMDICRAVCAQMEVDYQQLTAFASQAPKMYKVYAIPKRTSGKRIIAHPAKALKAYQKALLVPMADIFSVHYCA